MAQADAQRIVTLRRAGFDPPEIADLLGVDFATLRAIQENPDGNDLPVVGGALPEHQVAFDVVQWDNGAGDFGEGGIGSQPVSRAFSAVEGHNMDTVTFFGMVTNAVPADQRIICRAQSGDGIVNAVANLYIWNLTTGNGWHISVGKDMLGSIDGSMTDLDAGFQVVDTLGMDPTAANEEFEVVDGYKVQAGAGMLLLGGTFSVSYQGPVPA